MGRTIHFLCFLMLFFWSCSEPKITQSGTSVSSTTLPTIEPLGIETLELAPYPEEDLKKIGVEGWEDFIQLHESMERLKKLNLNDIEVDLIVLSGQFKKIMGPMPLEIETPEIKSRFKVVQMQVQKSKYYTQHYKNDSLVPSLKLVYQYYNALISRIETLNEEKTIQVIDSL